MVVRQEERLEAFARGGVVSRVSLTVFLGAGSIIVVGLTNNIRAHVVGSYGKTSLAETVGRAVILYGFTRSKHSHDSILNSYSESSIVFVDDDSSDFEKEVGAQAFRL